MKGNASNVRALFERSQRAAEKVLAATTERQAKEALWAWRRMFEKAGKRRTLKRAKPRENPYEVWDARGRPSSSRNGQGVQKGRQTRPPQRNRFSRARRRGAFATSRTSFRREGRRAEKQALSRRPGVRRVRRVVRFRLRAKKEEETQVGRLARRRVKRRVRRIRQRRVERAGRLADHLEATGGRRKTRRPRLLPAFGDEAKENRRDALGADDQTVFYDRIRQGDSARFGTRRNDS